MTLQIDLVESIPIQGYEPIGTLTNTERYQGHQIQGYTTKFFKDEKKFQISLENHASIFFSEKGRFKIYKDINDPSKLLATAIVTIINRKAKSENDKDNPNKGHGSLPFLGRKGGDGITNNRAGSVGNIQT